MLNEDRIKNIRKSAFIRVKILLILISLTLYSCATFPVELREQRQIAELAIQEILIENAKQFYCTLTNRTTYKGENEKPGECITYSSEFVLMWNEKYNHLGRAEIIFFSEDFLTLNRENVGFGFNGRFTVRRTNNYPGDEGDNFFASSIDIQNYQVITGYGISTDRKSFYRYDRQRGDWPDHPFYRTSRWRGVKLIDKHAWVFIDFGEFYATIEPYWIDLCNRERCANCKGPGSYYKIDIYR